MYEQLNKAKTNLNAGCVQRTAVSTMMSYSQLDVSFSEKISPRPVGWQM